MGPPLFPRSLPENDRTRHRLVAPRLEEQVGEVRGEDGQRVQDGDAGLPGEQGAAQEMKNNFFLKELTNRTNEE